MWVENESNCGNYRTLITKYDFALASLLPALKDFVFSSTPGNIGTGKLENSFTLPGGILLPAGSQITIVKEALLVNTAESIIGNKLSYINKDCEKLPLPTMEMKSENGSLVVLPFYTNPEELGYFYLLHASLGSDKVLKTAVAPLTKDDIIREVINETFSWFQANPPANDGSNLEARRAHSAIIDQLGLEPKPLVLTHYYYKWVPSFTFSYMSAEKQWPIYSYVRLTEEKVLEEIKATKITSGVRIWQMYNMGLIVKTPEKCFAIDFTPFNIDYTNVLDFIVVSHEHEDHLHVPFWKAMLSKGKPCYRAISTEGYRAAYEKYLYGLSETIIDCDKNIQQGPLLINFKLSSQGPLGNPRSVPCLITTIDCGPSTGNFTVLHGGDASIVEDFPSGNKIDFLDYTDGGPFDAILNRVNPVKANMGHLIELAHDMRIRYTYQTYAAAYKRVLSPKANGLGQRLALTWGESMFFGISDKNK